MTTQADPAPKTAQLARVRLASALACGTRTDNRTRRNAPALDGDTTEQDYAPDA
ncbi:hypothetical protein ACWGDT_05390 [Streptomyces avermitilis]